MFEGTKNSKEQGNVGVGQAIAYFTSKQFIVSIPLNDSQEYDLIVDDKESLKKVQVKTTRHKTKYGVFQVLLKTCGGNQSFHTTKHFDPNKCDYLFVVTSDGDQYCIPCSSFKAKSTLALGKDREQYKLKHSRQ